MIGQKKITEHLKKLIAENRLPRFCLLVGDKGSGRRTMSQWIGEQIGYTVEICGISADEVRDVIEQAYKTVTPILYVFADADNMSISAKNALLKVTEEPPNNARFIMTLMNVENTLVTIRSRATTFYMDMYTDDEIMAMYRQCGGIGDEQTVKDYCNTLYDVQLLLSYGIIAFKDYVILTIEHIDKVSGANSFKIGQKLDLGTDEKKYDLELFWKAFRVECLKRITDIPFKYAKGITITSDHMYDLRIAGVNKQMCFDDWVLAIRKDWMQYANSDEN